MTCNRSLWRTELGLIVVQSGTGCDVEDWWKLTVYSPFNSYFMFITWNHIYHTCVYVWNMYMDWTVLTLYYIIMCISCIRYFTSPNEMLHNICMEWDMPIYSKLLQWLARCMFRSQRICMILALTLHQRGWSQSGQTLWSVGLAVAGCKRSHLWSSLLGQQMGVSKNRGTPKWMVYNGNPIKMDDLGVPLFSETSKWCVTSGLFRFMANRSRCKLRFHPDRHQLHNVQWQGFGLVTA